MAVVWRGHDEVLGRRVAVKVLGPDLANDPAFVVRLRQEAQAAARLSHPNILNVHDYGEADDGDGKVRPFVVMEMLEGETLRSRLTEGRTLPWRRAVTVAAEVAAAMAAAHSRGIVHRDISSSNVMLTPTGAKVLDFGISALIGEHEPDDHDQLLGTPAYVAPERLVGADVTPAVDVYALGVLLYRALHGSLPWAVDTTTGLLEAHQWLIPTPLPPIPGMPAQVAQLCHRCLAKDPQARPSSAELAVAFARIARVPARVPPFADATPSEVTIAGRGTAVLPWRAFAPGVAAAADTESTPQQSTVVLTRRGRFTLAGMAIGLLLVVASGLAMARGDGRPPVMEPPAAVAAPPPPNCRVTYLQTSDTGGRFAAAITVHNSGQTPVEGWHLEFGWPGDQTLVGAEAGTWAQQGRQVVVRPPGEQAALAPGASHQFGLSGQYQTLNAMPASFALGGTRCESIQLAQVAQPVQQEEKPGGDGKGKNKGKGNNNDDDDDDDD